MNQYLSFSRIGLVMKREIMENWKANLYRFIGLYAAFMTPMVFRMYSMSGEKEWLQNPEWALGNYCQTGLNSFMFIIGIIAIVYASGIMENMVTKEKRISFLMLPATMLEKFVARFLFVTVGLLIAVLVAISLAEITRLLFVPLFDVPETLHGTVLPKMFSMFTNLIFVAGTDNLVGHEEVGGFSLGLLCVLCWIYGIWLHSIYILGGNVWYKKPFFKTIGVCLLIIILFGLLISNLIEIGVMQQFGNWLNENFPKNETSLNNLMAGGITFFSAFTLFNWWLSYRLFTRSQVIKPKFRLL